jgi:inosine-uridine nucleoside N-ribohydrolase
LIDTILGSSEIITLICIGPVPNIATALEREPVIAKRARFVGMHGCLKKSPPEYRGGGGIVAEYNVVADPRACQKVFNAPWDMTITPLDSCGFVRLTGQKYRAVRECKDPLIQALIENYKIWLKSRYENWGDEFEYRSSILFDTVAVYLSYSEEFRVTDDGYTVIDNKAKAINCATGWKDLPAFESFLVKRLTGRIC